MGGGSEGLEGHACWWCPTDRPPALAGPVGLPSTGGPRRLTIPMAGCQRPRGRVAAAGGAEVTATTTGWKGGNGDQFTTAVPMREVGGTVAGGAHGGRRNGFEGHACWWCPTGLSPAFAGPTSSRLAGGLRPIGRRVTTGGSGMAAAKTCWNGRSGDQYATIIIPMRRVGVPGAGGAHGGGLGGHEGHACWWCPTGRSPAFAGPTIVPLDGIQQPLGGAGTTTGGTGMAVTMTRWNGGRGGQCASAIPMPKMVVSVAGGAHGGGLGGHEGHACWWCPTGRSPALAGPTDLLLDGVQGSRG